MATLTATALALLAGIGLATGAAAQAPANFGPDAPPFAPKAPIAIVGGTLIDATGAPPKTGYTVLIEGNKIVKVAPSAEVAVPAGARTIDASGMTVMPGLISSNQHIQLNPLHPAPAADLPLDEIKARWEGNFAQMPYKSYVYLMQGVTSMRQTSGPWKRILPVKKRIDAGEIPGPRIFLGGALLMSPQFFKHYITKNRTPADAVDWMRNDFAYFVLDDIEKDTDQLLGADFNYWKLLLSDEEFDGKNDFTDAQIRRIIDKGHAAGKKIDIHANSTPKGFERLLKFNFDTLEHPFESSFLLDEKTIEGFAKKGVIVDTLLRVRVAGPEHAMNPNRFNETDYIMSSTPEDYRTLMTYRDRMLYNKRNPDHRGLAIYQPRASQSDMFGQDGPSLNDQMKARETARQNMRNFIKHKVKFSMGTDATAFLNFQQDDPNATEMEYMVEMGMTPMDSIIASTRIGAEALGLLDQLGTIEAGKLADVIVVAGDPLKSMDAMKRVAVVIKDGVRYK
ncbi:amidohydrolase family protein [Sphingomonas flavalba]|uniref:amidohydrolase family protein n=1 Tax=Sphingomonas flavalba TaxID=2559804 RepID=UPI00109D82D6|nr:amidohydrolase family protein [Sphingomonas flavalba]